MSTTTDPSLEATVVAICRKARAASLKLAALDTEAKNSALRLLAERLVENTDKLLVENAKDLRAGEENGLAKPLLERLTFTKARIEGMAEGVRQVADLEDPVGEELERTVRPNGLDIRKVRVPIGVIGIIYESRPNVTVDCAVLCLKSGNASILRGGKEAFHTNTALAGLIQDVLVEAGIAPEAVQFIPTTDRAALNVLLRQDETVHCIIPRGGEALIRFVAENALMPVIKHYTGVCCLYVDEAADPELAEKVVVNAKCQRPGVCNAAENLFVHRAVLTSLLPRIGKALAEQGVELRADGEAKKALEEAGVAVKEATEEDYHTEYLDLILSIKTVGSTEEAIEAVNTYGSGHSDCILTNDEAAAKRFLQSVDSSTVYWNASTRFTDGFEFGLGAEIGISTDRLHARGPMGLRELCTYKYCLYGTGQVK